MKWIRRLIFGRGSELGAGSLGGFAGAGRASVGMLAPKEGPFDRPPKEPPRLDPNSIPWELRDDEATTDI
jgi:hypothetical protein